MCDVGRWTTGDLWVAGDTNLISSNIKNGVELFGLTGIFTGWVDASISLTNFVSFTANKDAWNSVKWWVSGTLPQNTWNSLCSSYTNLVSYVWYVAYAYSGAWVTMSVFAKTAGGQVTLTSGGDSGATYDQHTAYDKRALTSINWLRNIEIDLNPSSTTKSGGWVNNYSFTFQR